MPYFCHQVSFTNEAWRRLMQNPRDHFQDVRGPIEKLGGEIQNSFFVRGAYDVLAITKFPEDVSVSAISAAFASGGSVATIQTAPLLSPAEAIEAVRSRHVGSGPVTNAPRAMARSVGR